MIKPKKHKIEPRLEHFDDEEIFESLNDDGNIYVAM